MATVFSGGTYISANQACTTKWSLMQFILQQLAKAVTNAGWTNLALDNGVGAQGPGNQGTCTITIASPAVVTFNGHGFLGGEKIMFATTGALPTGLSVNTVYFVKFIGANTFNVSTTSGGSNINTSGTQSGVQTVYSQTVLLKSATQANVTNPIVVKVQDNAGSCIQISISNSAFTVNGGNGTSNGGSLLPTGSANFQILATQYRFEYFLIGASGNRKFVMAGMGNVPSLVTDCTDHGYMLCDSKSDSDATVRNSFRTGMNISSTGNSGVCNSQVIWNGNLLEHTNSDATNSGDPQAAYLRSNPSAFSAGVDGYYRFENGKLIGSDVFLTSGLVSSTDESKYKSQFYDLEFGGGAFAIDATDNWAGHNWYNLTNNVVQGGAWVATS